jgi:uncharacterized phage-associated protein
MNRIYHVLARRPRVSAASRVREVTNPVGDGGKRCIFEEEIVHGMATALDVAQYILQRHGPVPAMKLQKLVYYSQAWSLVWDDKPLFDNHIEAWANGPVVRDLYELHRAQFTVTALSKGDSAALSQTQRETVDSVLKFYGDKSSQWLSDLTHQENPWRDARCGIPPGEYGDREITQAALAEYYGSL